MTPIELVEDMMREFRAEGGGRRRPRKYVGGLLPSFAKFLLDLETPGKGYADLSEFFETFHQITVGVSTLTVEVGQGGKVTKTIRPAYNDMHAVFIAQNRRLDYPRSEPYATGKWADYRHWLDVLLGYSAEQLQEVIDVSTQFVLDELPEHELGVSSIPQEPALFSLLLQEFDFSARAKNENTGASFQAMVFAWVRADAPHLQVQGRKARAGSARTKNVGDVDAWDGDRLLLSVEAKHFIVAEKDLDNFTHFSSLVITHGAMGLVVALGFREGVRENLEETGLRTLTLDEITQRVALWDTVKQRIAINAFLFVVVQIEQQSGLIGRVREFIAAKLVREGATSAGLVGATDDEPGHPDAVKAAESPSA